LDICPPNGARNLAPHRADDGLAPDATALIKAIEAKGGHQATVKHFTTDHSFSDHRIALEGEIINWLAALLKQNQH